MNDEFISYFFSSQIQLFILYRFPSKGNSFSEDVDIKIIIIKNKYISLIIIEVQKMLGKI